MFTAVLVIVGTVAEKWKQAISGQNAIYPYTGILFGYKKKPSTDTYYNRDEPWKHYAEWKESDNITKGYIMSDSKFIKCSEQANP